MKHVKKLSAILACILLMSSCSSNEGFKVRTRDKTKKTTEKTSVESDATTSESSEETSSETSETIESTVSTLPTGAEDGVIAFPSHKLYQYDMDLVLNETDRTIGGHVVFEFYNDSEDVWKDLCFRDYPSLFKDAETAKIDYQVDLNGAITEITGIRDQRDGSSPEYKREDDVSVIWMDLKEPLKPGEWMTLEYDFKATIPELSDRYGVSSGCYNVTNFYPVLAEYVDGAWSHEAYYSAGECFYSEIADFDVDITVPSSLVMATSGTEKERKADGDLVTYSYEAPCIRSFAFCCSENFVVIEGEQDGVHINLFLDPDDIFITDVEATKETALQVAKDSLLAFDEAFGQYPYEELDVIIDPIDSGGMEYPNLVIISSPSTTFYIDAEKPYDALRACLSHEIGHQWFMGIVGSNSGLDPWLDESLTSYTEVVYFDACGTVDSMVDLYEKSASGLRLPGMDDKTLDQSYYMFPDDMQYSTAIYVSGKLILYRMENILGKKVFRDILKEYVRRNAFTNAKPEDFFEVLYEYAGKDNERLNSLIGANFTKDYR